MYCHMGKSLVLRYKRLGGSVEMERVVSPAPILECTHCR